MRKIQSENVGLRWSHESITGNIQGLTKMACRGTKKAHTGGIQIKSSMPVVYDLQSEFPHTGKYLLYIN